MILSICIYDKNSNLTSHPTEFSKTLRVNWPTHSPVVYFQPAKNLLSCETFKPVMPEPDVYALAYTNLSNFIDAKNVAQIFF